MHVSETKDISVLIHVSYAVLFAYLFLWMVHFVNVSCWVSKFDRIIYFSFWFFCLFFGVQLLVMPIWLTVHFSEFPAAFSVINLVEFLFLATEKDDCEWSMVLSRCDHLLRGSVVASFGSDWRSRGYISVFFSLPPIFLGHFTSIDIYFLFASEVILVRGFREDCSGFWLEVKD